MARQIRVAITEEAYELLRHACAEQDATQGHVVNAALLTMLQGKQESDHETTALEGQNLRIMAMLQHLMEAMQCWPMAVPEDADDAHERAQPHEGETPRTVLANDLMAFYAKNNGWPKDVASEPEDLPGIAPRQKPGNKFIRLFVKG